MVTAAGFVCLLAGADIIGVNCNYDPDVCLKSMKIIKEGLDKAGLKRHLMVQPAGYKTPECMDHNNPGVRIGFTGLAEFPFGMHVRTILLYLIYNISMFTALYFVVCFRSSNGEK